jgi:Zn-finger domain-containing protein
LGRTPTALTSDQLKTAGDPAHDERLNDAAGLNRSRELVESFLAKARARLIRARIDQLDADVEEAFTQRWGRRRCRCCWRSQWVARRYRRLLLRLRQRC